MGSVALGQSAYTLGFAGQTTYNSDPAGTVKSDQPYDCTLGQTGGTAGAQGWSLSMTMENGSITDITTTGSAVDALFAGGFNKTELTVGAGNEGAVSAIVLSFTQNRTLQLNTVATIAKLKTRFTIPTGTGTATLRYVDNRKGSGQPVQNAVTEEGNTVNPTKGTLPIQLQEKVVAGTCCGKPLILGFSPTKVKNTTQYDGIVDEGAGSCTGQGGKIVKSTDLGVVGEQHVFADIASNLDGDGAQGWSFSIESSGNIVMVSATTAGTSVDPLFAGGFNKTETIDPAKNPPGKQGAVSAIVLSFTQPRFLPAKGTDSVLDLDIKADKGQTEAPIVGKLAFVDNLKGSGQPVQNAVTVNGDTKTPCNGPPNASAEVSISFEKSTVAAARKFRRGNPNNDSKIDIADAIWIVNELFRSGPKTACPPAADINGDGTLNIDDAVYLINYEFKGGPKPPAPFSEVSTQCGTAPASATCPEDQSGCT
jgi:hypothetical protein